MFKIGDFSRLTRVSVKMLRHYDELGLLKPARIDPDSSYRYYSADQLPRLNRIIALKDLGFALDQIGKLVEGQLPPDEIRGMLKLRRAEVEERLNTEQARLAQVESRLREMEQEQRLPIYDVVVREIAPQLMATIRQTVADNGSPITQLFEELASYVAGYGARAPDLPPLAIYYDPDYREENLDVEVAVPLNGEIPDSDRVAMREIAGADTMACVVYTGNYDKATEVLSALLIWVQSHGYNIAGPIREVYLRYGSNIAESIPLPRAFLTDNRNSYVTEVQLPITNSR